MILVISNKKVGNLPTFLHLERRITLIAIEIKID